MSFGPFLAFPVSLVMVLAINLLLDFCEKKKKKKKLPCHID
jgi:hypothetical protein